MFCDNFPIDNSISTSSCMVQITWSLCSSILNWNHGKRQRKNTFRCSSSSLFFLFSKVYKLLQSWDQNRPSLISFFPSRFIIQFLTLRAEASHISYPRLYGEKFTFVNRLLKEMMLRKRSLSKYWKHTSAVSVTVILCIFSPTISFTKCVGEGSGNWAKAPLGLRGPYLTSESIFWLWRRHAPPTYDITLAFKASTVFNYRWLFECR